MNFAVEFMNLAVKFMNFAVEFMNFVLKIPNCTANGQGDGASFAMGAEGAGQFSMEKS